MPIDETLFRRMRQFLNNGNEIPDSYNSSGEIYNRLEQLLYYLYQEDCKRDPLAFALTWTLVALLVEEQLQKEQIQSNQNSTGGISALQEEIESWFKDEFMQEIRQRSDQAKKLLATPCDIVTKVVK